MALNFMLRRASSSLIPLAIRTVGSPRTFHSAISAVLGTEKCSFSRSSVVPFQRFSTKPTSDEKLIEVLESEINCSDQPSEKHIPDGFPFEFQDNPGERTILLTRKYQDEIIKVEVDMPNVDDEEDEDEDEVDNERKEINDSIPLVVSITKGSGTCLEFGVTALPDDIQIDHLSMKRPENSEDQLAYDGPDFTELDENLQKAFHKYLENRGIKPSTTNFLLEYMINKDSKEYLHWLNNLKKFIEK
ncbi:hypothetical protein LWI29_022800 [Acer saccharum]|uniref:Mitochondrial glycoprotein n=1 Tax=Acer saccharum TaxID=4024 RepID=A0AA39VGZ2_ACESA|nr:hypothetical protein LWI29_022800 [Acer saccharum]